ncbi:MAG TPA: hypothetical protein VFF54_07265 [Thermodesulfobacteriota bacterium]|nr:hypothetical protein [Thermodesulfobacteriota bacterium]
MLRVIFVKITVMAFSILFLISFVRESFAYKVSTHRAITSAALSRSQNYNDFVNGLNVNSNKTVIDGSEWEDGETEVDHRWYNHYYDPVNARGLSLSGFGTIGKTSKEWAYDGGGGYSRYPSPNYYSWVKAREYMYKGLTGRDFAGNTVASNQTERNNYFKGMFRSVGQVVHLVQDLAQPSHVRNDPHASKYENYIGSIILNPSRLEDWTQANEGVVNGYLNLAGMPKSFLGFNNYFDTFASFTNTNFLSDDTIFKNYSMPSEEQTGIVYDAVEDGDGHKGLGIYYVKTGGLLTGHKLANAGYLWYDLSFHRALKAIIFDTALKIDDKVAQENAQKLIPMAVEFSAGLLNYFFRGSIDMKPDTQNAGKYIIENLSAEDMSGAFGLYYDDKDDNRSLITNWNLSINAEDKSEPKEFTEPTDAKEKGKYILVFNGALGSEAEAVMGKVVSITQDEDELILYGVNGVYKTYDPETKEIKPYDGIFKGATGRIIWRHDGKAAIIHSQATIVDIKNNTKRAIAVGYNVSGWREDTAIFAYSQPYGPYDPFCWKTNTCYHRLHMTEALPDGALKSYDVNFTLPRWGFERIDTAISKGGKQIAISGYIRCDTTTCYDYYLLKFDTVSKETTVEKIGEGRSKFSIFSNTGTWSTVSHAPFIMAYYGDNLNVLYGNSEKIEAKTCLPGSIYYYNCPYYSKETTYESSIDTIGEFKSNKNSVVKDGQSQSYNGVSRSIFPLGLPGYFIMENGTEIKSYGLYEQLSSYPPYSSSNTITPYLLVGGEKIEGRTLTMTSGGYEYTTILNLNASGDKAVVSPRLKITIYGTILDEEKMAYYVSDEGIRNLLSENPEMGNATFLAIIKE